ncbi:hypothetical protein V8D89_009080 [Ganoderma adspersum]
MWLLSTDRAELKFFVTPESVPGGYAILSHVWDENEQPHQELQKLRRECAKSGANPRDHASEKIRRCCELAEQEGYKWLWADTCCIDKTSSSELSEAINSMFCYYSLADVCYVYLRDVPDGDDVLSSGSAFGRSRWHRRAWTLQELLAPYFVVFLSKDWDALGSKVDLAEVLEEITRIPQSVMSLRRSLSHVSVAERMSWAAGRETTRPEDVAYCLMGLFDIHMTTLYGEGGQEAFRRLQEEIMQRSLDTSLFAWGKQFPRDSRGTSDSPSNPHAHRDDMCLFAPSPDVFWSTSMVHPIEDQRWKASQGIGTLLNHEETLERTVFSLTTPAYAVFARIPLLSGYGYGSGEASIPQVVIATLDWTCTRGKERLGLLLSPCPQSVDRICPLYDVGASGYRLISLGEEDIDLEHLYLPIPTKTGGRKVLSKWTWTVNEVYLVHRPSRAAVASPHFPLNLRLFTPFRFLSDISKTYNARTLRYA